MDFSVCGGVVFSVLRTKGVVVLVNLGFKSELLTLTSCYR